MDVEQARRDAPGVGQVAHFNNAGASLPPRQVTEAVIAHLEREGVIGGYEAADAAREMIDHTYVSIARLIGDEIGRLIHALRARPNVAV